MSDQVDTKALQTQYAGLVKEAKSLLGQWAGKEHEMPAEIGEKINGLLGQSDTLKARIEIINRVQDGENFANAVANTPVAWRQAAPTEGNAPTDRKSWREVECDTVVGKKTVRYNVPLMVERNEKSYAAAYEGYLNTRYFTDLGPNDRKTLAEGTDSAGGFFVPPDFQATVIKKMMTLVQIRANAMISQTSRDSQQWPKINYTSDNNYTSGVRLTWTGESPATASTHRVTDPVTGMYTIPVHTAMASIPLSNDLLDDSAVDVAGITSDLFAEAFALGEENAFINGTGTGQPMGILSEIGTNGPSSTTTAGVGVIAGDDLIKTFYGVAVQYRQRGKWLMGTPSMQAIELLKDSQNRYLISSMLNASLAMPQFDTLKGKPILIQEFMPSIASNNYPIIYGDFSGYLILDRVGLSIQKLQEVYAELNVTVLLGRKRVGGYCVRPWQFNALKVQ